jgi:UDP-GlcNAc3NAcA epimerase
MSDIFFKEMRIPRPDYFLGINGKVHGAMTGQMMEKIEEVLIDEQPDMVLVYGDTNSTLAGALAAKKLHIKIAHVEAGLRSYNIRMPEEVNRILTDRISDILLCPTEQAIKNLQSEGFENFDCRIENTGDVMQDAAIFYSKFAEKPSVELPDSFCLATVHRAENTDDPNRLVSIFEALNEISKDCPIVLPLHPRTKSKLEVLDKSYDNIMFLEPIGYLNMIWLLRNCQKVLTDSGGLQKEAFFFGKPCITLRDETEWVELIDNGFNHLAGAKKDLILSLFKKKSEDLNFNLDLYGMGNAAFNIMSTITN